MHKYAKNLGIYFFSTDFRMSYFILVAPLLIFLLSTQCSQDTRNQKNYPKAIKGILDLRTWNLLHDGPLNLNGEWEFYWRKILDASSFDSSENVDKRAFVPVPRSWNLIKIGDSVLGPMGFATYRLRLIMTDSLLESGIHIPWQRSAYDVWVNGKKVVSMGTPGTTASQTIPRYVPQMAFFPLKHDTNEIVIHISNFNLLRGGIRIGITLGSEAQIRSAYERSIAEQLFVCGAFAIMMFYHLAYFLLRRRDLSALWFGCLCIVGATVPLVVGDFCLMYLLPGMPVEIELKIEYLLNYTPLMFFLLFLRALFPKFFSLLVTRVFCAISLIYIVGTIFLPSSIFMVPLGLFHVFASVCFAYICFALIRAILDKSYDAVFALFGSFLVIICMAIDIASHYELLRNISYITHIGAFLFLFSQSIMLSRRFARVYSEAETMASRLSVLDKLKDQFLANTSHELRTPLTGIIGIAQLLLAGDKGALSKEQQESIGLIVKSGRRLNAIVNDILDIAKIKNNQLTIKIQPLDVRSITSVLFEMLTPLVGEKPLELHNDIPKSLPLVAADEGRLQQILYNLLDNAIKFTDQGAIRVTAAQEGSRIHVHVGDTGIGIPADKQSSIFEPFEQVEQVGLHEHGGTGLGLSICKKLVELHHGTISVESFEGKGSTFTFSVPIADGVIHAMSNSKLEDDRDALSIHSYPASSGTKQDTPNVRPSVAGGRTILIIDDEDINIRVLESQLASGGYEILSAYDGAAGLEIIGKQRPDLILLDLMMPRMNGFEVCRRIRKLYHLSDLPVIILTARSQESAIIEAYTAGANDYMIKPFSRQELLARINTHLQVKDSIQKLKEIQAEVVRAGQLTSLGELAAGVAHEITTPINAIINFAQILIDSAEQGRCDPEFARHIAKEGRRIDAIVKSLLKFGRAGKKEKVSAHIIDVINETITLTGAQLRKDNISVSVNVPDDIPAVAMNFQEMQQVFMNLISNSRYALNSKFEKKPDLKKTISISASYEAGQVNSLRMVFHDNGCGIPASNITKIGNPFFTTKPEGKGTGLGMSISHGIIADHNGTLTIESIENEYTSIIITLPCDGRGKEQQ